MDTVRIKKALANELPFVLQHFDTIDSTNRYLYQNARRLPEFQVVTADTQTEGRGRLQREWHSSPGKGLWFSVLLRPPLAGNQLQLVALYTAVIMARSIGATMTQGELDSKRPSLKWPNDILINGKKVAGILLNACFRGNNPDFLVIGIGVNTLQKEVDFPVELQGRAASLSQLTGRHWHRDELLIRFLQRFSKSYQGFLDNPPEIVNRFKKQALFLGTEIEVLDGTSKRKGVFRDLTPDGHLILQAGNNPQIISSGDMTVSNW